MLVNDEFGIGIFGKRINIIYLFDNIITIVKQLLLSSTRYLIFFTTNKCNIIINIKFDKCA